MNFLVTGANGFLANNLIKKLKENNHNVTSISRKDFDLSDTSSVNNFFQDKYFDFVIHCAVSGGRRLSQDSADIVYLNLKMLLNILINKNQFGKFITFGSGAELDRNLQINGTHNFSDVLPEDFYGFSKNVIARLIYQESNAYNLRIFNVFDSNESDGRFIKTCLHNYINNKPIIINQDKYMDFIYFEDFYTILNKFIYNEIDTKVIDCVYDVKYKLSNIAEIVNNLGDHKVDIVILNKNQGNNYCGKNSLNNSQFYGLEMGIKKIYEELL
jgi:nucleoside-diphosphate-sugar epimerase